MRRLATALAVVALGCAEGTPPGDDTAATPSRDQSTAAPTTQPAARPASQPATRPTAPREAADASARTAARRSYDAMGGKAGFDRAAAINFGFAVHRGDQQVILREHLWDRRQGRDRVSGRDREGKPYTVVVDLDDRSGWAELGGQLQEGAELHKWLERAYASWVNDSYWLLMPAKLLDPGVVLKDEGRVEVDGESYHKLQVTFEEVGLTPGDTYWAFFDPESGLMGRWEYVLQGQQLPAAAWSWEDWHWHGPLRLANVRRQVGGDGRIDMDPLEVLDKVPLAAFEPP